MKVLGRDSGTTFLFLLLLVSVLAAVDWLMLTQTAALPLMVFLGAFALTSGPILWIYFRNAGYRIDGSTTATCLYCGHFTVEGRPSERLNRQRLRALTQLGFWRAPVYLPLLYLAWMRIVAPATPPLVPGMFVEDALFEALLVSGATLFFLRRVFMPPPVFRLRRPRATTKTP